jgi:hypothetical protein
VARPKKNDGKLSVFKGRESKLNRAIFHALATEEPQTIYDIHKQIRTLKGLRHTKYTNVSRRVRALEESCYLEKGGVRNTQAGVPATLYKLATRAQVALLLDKVSLDVFVQKADEDTLIAELAALTLFLKER